jgi:micrococcal nuclease
MSMWTYRAIIIRVVDGDTVDVRIDLGFSVLHEARLRLLGIDAPEMLARDPAERERARAATARLSALLPVGAAVTVTTQKDRREKYGRYLARIVAGETDVCATLLAEGLVAAY